MHEHGEAILALGADVLGAYAIETDPGDAIIFDVKCYHGAFPDGLRRGLYLNSMAEPKNEKDEEYVWSVGGCGGWHTRELSENAPPHRSNMLKFWQERRESAA